MSLATSADTLEISTTRWLENAKLQLPPSICWEPLVEEVDQICQPLLGIGQGSECHIHQIIGIQLWIQDQFRCVAGVGDRSLEPG